MKTNSTHKFLLYFLTLLLAFAIWLHMAVAQTISIDKNIRYQTMEGFGGFGPKKVWWESGPYYDAAYLNQTIDSLGVTIFRTQIYWDGEPVNDDSNPNTFNWSGFNFGPATDNGKQFPFIRDLAAKGAKLIGTVWTPPVWMKLFDEPDRIPSECYNCGNCPIGSEARKPCGGRLNPVYYSEFAEYLVAYVKTLKLQTGVDLYAISIQNEPWFANPFEANVMRPAEYADVLKVVAERFNAEGLTTLFFGPEHMAEWSWGIQQQYVNEILGDATVKPHLDMYAVHGYVDGVAPDYGTAAGWTSLYNNITAAHGKPLWMTETSAGETGYTLAFNMSRSLYLAIKFGRISGWIYWYMADVMISNNQLTPLGYAFKNFYRYVRPGAANVSATSSDPEILSLAFDHVADSATTIVLINNGTTMKTVSINVTGGSIPSQYTIYRTSATENCINAGVLSATGTLQLPPQSITTLDHRPADTQVPSIPTDLASSSIGLNSFTLSWTPSSDNKAVAGYDIFRNGTLVASAAANTYNATGLVAGTTYSYTVRAKDGAGNLSAQSLPISVTMRGNSLVAYWSFDEVNGTTAADGSGNGNNATLMNGASFAGGKKNNALTLNGAGSWANIPNKTFSGNFTIAAWVNLTGTISSADALIGQEGAGQDINFTSARIRFYTGSSNAVTATQSLTAGVWKHYTIRRSGSSISIYIDGVLNATGTYSGSFNPKAIGRGNAGANTRGKIDEMYIYNRALTATEITDLFNGIAARNAAEEPLAPVAEEPVQPEEPTPVSDRPITTNEAFNNDEVEVYPNPLTGTDGLTIRMWSDISTPAVIQLLRSDTKKVVEQTVLLNPGSNTVKIPASRLRTGVYIIRVRKEQKDWVKKVIVNK
jgi:glucuronoarabinoxylan endo-1,4-beta-xylanase